MKLFVQCVKHDTVDTAERNAQRIDILMAVFNEMDIFRYVSFIFLIFENGVPRPLNGVPRPLNGVPRPLNGVPRHPPPISKTNFKK